MTSRVIESVLRWTLDRLILRPSTHPLDPGPKLAIDVPITVKKRSIRTVAFVEQVAADDQDDQRAHDVLVLKFAGTSGRAERSSLFPLPMLLSGLERHHQKFGSGASSSSDGCHGSVVTWNPPGYGNSEHHASLQYHVDAGVDFFDQMVNRFALNRQTKVYLCGNSLGCCLAMGVATRRPELIDGLVLRNPPQLDAVVERIANRYPLGHLAKHVTSRLPDSLNAVGLARQLRTPAVFLRSEFDRLVPQDLQQMVHDHYTGPTQVVVLDGIDHDGLVSDQHRDAIESAMHWLVRETTR